MTDLDLDAELQAVLARQAQLLVPPDVGAASVMSDHAANGAPLQRPNGHRRPNRSALLVAAAAVLVVVVSALGIVAAVRSVDESISTDQPTTTTVEPTSSSTATTQAEDPPDAPFELGAAAQLLPPVDEWVMVGYDEYPASGSDDDQPDLDVYVFERNGLYLLSSQPGGSEPVGLDAATPETSFNRVTLWWDVDGRQLGLFGFGVDPSDVVAAATELVEIDGRWSLPGAEEVYVEQGVDGGSSGTVQIEYAPVGPDGAVDLTRSIMQVSSERGLGNMYLELGEASSLGEVSEADIAEGTGFVMVGSSPQYALHHADGWVSSWQTNSAEVDLPRFVESLVPISNDAWAEATENVEGTRRAALEATAAGSEPVPVVELPRFLLDEPWELTRVHDESQWTAEERALQRARVEATNGSPTYEVRWVQTFRLAGNEDALVPDVYLEVQEYYNELPLGSGAEGGETVTVAGFEGSLFSGENAPSIRATAGDLLLEIQGPGLTSQELASFAASLAARSPGGLDGFDFDDEGYIPGLDGPSPYDELGVGTESWFTNWDGPDGGVRIFLQKAPPGLVELNLVFMATYVGAETEQTPGEPFYVTSSDGYNEVLWHQPDLGVYVRLDGDSIDTALAAARALRQVSEEEWVATVGPLVEPFDLSGGN